MMKKNGRHTDREWAELASLLSGEKDGQSDLLDQFRADDNIETTKKWKELRIMNDEKEINVDKAWNNVYTRMIDDQNKAAATS